VVGKQSNPSTGLGAQRYIKTLVKPIPFTIFAPEKNPKNYTNTYETSL
jgi:hypothetical protein